MSKFVKGSAKTRRPTLWLGLCLALAMVLSAGCGSPSSDDSGENLPSVSVLRWTKPTTYADGITPVNVSRYRLYYGDSPVTLQAIYEFVTAGSSYQLSNAEIEVLAAHMEGNGTHYFALTAIDNDGVESRLSEIYEYV